MARVGDGYRDVMSWISTKGNSEGGGSGRGGSRR